MDEKKSDILIKITISDLVVGGAYYTLTAFGIR